MVKLNSTANMSLIKNIVHESEIFYHESITKKTTNNEFRYSAFSLCL